MALGSRGRRAEPVRAARRGGAAGWERYWFLDEITSVPAWPEAIKWLRDNTAFGDDCVVLTGSSARDLADAQKQHPAASLAGCVAVHVGALSAGGWLPSRCRRSACTRGCKEDFLRALWDVTAGEAARRRRQPGSGAGNARAPHPRSARHQRRGRGSPRALHRMDAQRLSIQLEPGMWAARRRVVSVQPRWAGASRPRLDPLSRAARGCPAR